MPCFWWYLSALHVLFLLHSVSGDETPKKLEVSDKIKGLLNRFRLASAAKHNLKIPQADISFDGIKNSLPPDFDDGTELTMNREIIASLFENDIVITEPQINMILENLNSERRTKRKIIRQTSYRWGRTIYYRVSTANPRTRSGIQIGIRHWEENTCLDFQEIASTWGDHLNFIVGQGCYSNIGRLGRGQDVSIGSGCETRGIVAHEIGHALGLWHEQSRPDRDRFITVNYGSIDPQAARQYEKRTNQDTLNFGVPYDLGSVMHYAPSYYVTRPGSRSIDAKDPLYQHTMGQREGLSFTDIKVINKAYCSDTCRGRGGSCKNGGYADPRSCSRCKCPEGLAGNCDRAAPSTPGCGGDLVATASWKTVTVNRMSPHQRCYWVIKSNNGAIVEAKMVELGYPCADTCTSYVEVKAKGGFEQAGPRLCCSTQSGASFVADSDTLVLIHKTDSSTGSMYRGFTVQYRARTNGRPLVRTTPRPSPRPPIIIPIPISPKPVPRTTSRRPGPSGGWLAWSKWSPCTRSCGGCGVKQRSRQCGSLCLGEPIERAKCGENRCPVNKVVEGKKCEIAQRVPCWMVRRRVFSPESLRVAGLGVLADLPSGTSIEKVEEYEGLSSREIRKLKRKEKKGGKGKKKNNKGLSRREIRRLKQKEKREKKRQNKNKGLSRREIRRLKQKEKREKKRQKKRLRRLEIRKLKQKKKKERQKKRRSGQKKTREHDHAESRDFGWGRKGRGIGGIRGRRSKNCLLKLRVDCGVLGQRYRDRSPINDDGCCANYAANGNICARIISI